MYICIADNEVISTDALNDDPVIIKESLDYIQKTLLTKAKGRVSTLKRKKKRKKSKMTMLEQKGFSI